MWAALHEWFTTARCQGCPSRVKIIGKFMAKRRESAYCKTCLSLMGVEHV